MRGSILSVNRDPYGTPVTYAGYLLLGVSMIGTLCSKRSGFRRLLRHPLLKRAGFLLLFASVCYGASAGAPATLDRETARRAGPAADAVRRPGGSGPVIRPRPYGQNLREARLRKIYGRAGARGLDILPRTVAARADDPNQAGYGAEASRLGGDGRADRLLRPGAELPARRSDPARSGPQRPGASGFRRSGRENPADRHDSVGQDAPAVSRTGGERNAVVCADRSGTSASERRLGFHQGHFPADVRSRPQRRQRRTARPDRQNGRFPAGTGEPPGSCRKDG